MAELKSNLIFGGAQSLDDTKGGVRGWAGVKSNVLFGGARSLDDTKGGRPRRLRGLTSNVMFRGARSLDDTKGGRSKVGGGGGLGGHQLRGRSQ